ncbi:MAG: ABC transporter ATP-binding protein [Alphaproteobacteria bacterium]
MIDVKNLSARYGQHVACADVSLSVKPGEIVVILGANGVGKSTLLKAIAGVCEGHVSGTVTLDGTNLMGREANEIVDLGLAMVPENRGIFANLPVIENLRLGAYTERARTHEAANLALVHELFPKLQQRRAQIVRTMSGGEQQMVAIGRAMMSAPSILMLDEPSLGLSPLLSKDLFSRLKAIREAGLGILLVEQNAKGSLAIADRGYVLENGRITHAASAAELREDPAVQAAYLGAGKTSSAGKGAVKTAVSVGEPQEKASGAATAPRPPRPGSQNPADIAQAAMAGFAPRDRTPPQPTPDPTPPPAPRAAAPIAPAPPAEVPAKSAAVAPSSSSGVPGIGDLVSKAEARSRAQRRRDLSLPQSAERNAPPSATTSQPPATRPSPSATTSLSAQGANGRDDRLQRMLDEFEQAAYRARTSRPIRPKDV